MSPINNYKYNGKELQDELGLNVYDYGARFYDPAAPRFWQIDRLTEAYNFQTPYAYAINNPVRFIDKKGMAPEWIIGNDGEKVTYSKNSDGSVTWSANASADTQKIGNAMMKTAYGTSQFKKWDKSNTEVSIEINKTSKSRKAHAKTKPQKSKGKFLLNKDGQYKKIKVVFYDKAIDKALGDGKRYDGASKEEALGSIGSHEVDHNDPDQIVLDKTTNGDEKKQSPRDNKPINSEVDFRREYHKKYPNSGKIDWEMPYKNRGYEGN